MYMTHITHVCRIDVWAGAVGGGLSLLEVVPSCIQSLIQLSETGLQLARLTCTEVRTVLRKTRRVRSCDFKTFR